MNMLLDYFAVIAAVIVVLSLFRFKTPKDNLCQQAQKRGEIISPPIQQYIDAHSLPHAYRRRRRRPK